MGTLSSLFVLVGVKYFSGKTVPKDVVVNHGKKQLEQSSTFFTTQREQTIPTELNFNDHTNLT